MTREPDWQQIAQTIHEIREYIVRDKKKVNES